MKRDVETLEDVDREYGPIVGALVTRLAALSKDDTELADLVDPVVVAIEEVITSLGFRFERKEGF